MYYLKLIQKFWDFNQKTKLSTSAIAVYLYLLKLANDNDGYDVTISDVAISKDLGIARTTVIPAKEKLRSLGLIQYVNKKGISCHYRMQLDYSLDTKSEKLKEQENSNDNHSRKQELLEIPLRKRIRIHKSFEVLSKEKTTNDLKEFPENSQGQPQNNNNIPCWEEFYEYAKTLKGYENFLDQDIKEKYALWSGNNCRNALGRSITNWKSTLKNIFPYLKNSTKNHSVSLQDIPNIKRPKSQDKD